MRISHHFVKEKIEARIIQAAFVGYKAQTTNIFTKGLVGPLFQRHVNKLSMMNIHVHLAREC